MAEGTAAVRSCAPGPASRFDQLDLLKCYAVVLVVLVHVSAPGSYLWHAVPERHWWIATAFGAFARVCVPLFLMASGATLLDIGKVEPIGPFFTRRVRRILLPLLIWSAVYLADQMWLGGHAFTLWEVLRALLLGTTFYHMPFFYYLIGLYLCAPVLARFTDSASAGSARYFVLLWLAISCQLLASDLSGYAVGVPVPVVGGFVGYFVLGRLLRDVAVSGRAAAGCALAALACTAATLVATYWRTRHAGVLDQMFFEYGRPNIILMSGSSFLLLSSAPVRRWLATRPRVVAWVRAGASAGLGVFLVHPLLLQTVMPRLGLAWNSFGAFAGILVSLLVLLALSAAAVWTLRRIPGVRAAVS